jgi:hypothetical protein
MIQTDTYLCTSNIGLTPSLIHTVHCDCFQKGAESNPITSTCIAYLLYIFEIAEGIRARYYTTVFGMVLYVSEGL